MLGNFLRSKIAIILAILGLLVLGTGIGQRTIWLPPATLTAAVPVQSTPAPLTVIGPELLKTRDGQFTLTIKSDGPLQLAVGREDDVLGWVGDAAYTGVGGANEDFTELAATSHAGAESVPDPAGSDMWVSEEKATGELSYTWQAPGHGDWALLLSVDGKAAAPTDLSITVDNEAGTPWAVPLMIIGSALLALAALMFLLALNKPAGSSARGTAVPAGRRTAGRVPADPATGALEVEKIVAAREAAKKAAAGAGPATIAEADKTSKADKAEKAGTVGTAGADQDGANAAEATSGADKDAAALDPTDATSSLPLLLTKSEETAVETGSDAKNDAGEDPAAANTPAAENDSADSASDADSDSDSDEDANSDSDSDSGTGTDADSAQGKTAKGKNAQDKSAQEKSEFRAVSGSVAKVKKHMKSSTRWGAALAAVLVAGSLSPAIAADETTPASGAATDSATATAAATESASAAATEAPGFPALLDSQVQRIASAVAAAVSAGDSAKNAKELEVRVAGMALETRSANYKIRAKVSKQAAMAPVNAAPLLAKVVTTTQTWPRSAMLVTQGEDNPLPQLLTLVQAGPRENYKLIHATPLLPGQTFPKADKEGSKEISLDSADGLLMSPADAVAALSDRLTKADSKFKTTFNDSVYIQSVLDTQADIVKNAKDASYVFSHKAQTDAAVNLRTADGGVTVVVGYDFGISATSKEDATLTVGEDAAVFTGGKETTKGFTLTYAEPVVMYIPPAGADSKITILSATRNLVGGSFKK